ncbi:DUF6340 family protein [Maribacter sp. 2307UL18-2]|uniref:DUF6340 family protein n=1 Tax=Maribacter sp. 2307UL18-2 TaxID=3386274 RepID=UPI0039BC6D9C
MKQIAKLLMVGVVLFVSSCGSKQQLAIKSMEPAKVDLSAKIVRVGVLNSVEPEEQPKATKGIEGLVAIEDQWLIQQAQNAALEALVSELREDNRFEVELLVVSGNELRKLLNDSEGTSWEKIKTLCTTHDIDALFSLTHFDAETEVSLRKTKMEQLNMMREKEKVSAHEITLETLIQNNWKIYDPVHEKIIDEYAYDQQLVAKAKGIDPIAALRAIGSRKDSLMSKGKLVGNSFGERLKPYERKIIREYFVKGTDNLVKAGEIMASGDIDSAAALWRKDAENSNKKIKGRACHNMAVGMEFEGKLIAAHEWATKANQNLNDKASQSYLKELENRLDRQPIVEAQMANLNFED